jgi:hypothetical protein
LQELGTEMIAMAEPRKRGRPKDPASARSRGENPKKGIPRVSVELSRRQKEALDQLVKSINPRPKLAAVIRDALVEYAAKRQISFPGDETPGSGREDESGA